MTNTATTSKTLRHVNGPAVRAFRDLRGLRNGDLANLTGLSPTTITRIEASGRNVSTDAQTRIADALGVPVEAVSYPLA